LIYIEWGLFFVCAGLPGTDMSRHPPVAYAFLFSAQPFDYLGFYLYIVADILHVKPIFPDNASIRNLPLSCSARRIG
ncbi:hypothetical protein, partial [Chimaeribacter arupi]|uniref:hypothetical protein n=1 Tax=Chimaeribacter arupi TaxID=2060066 RepID=UPI002944ACF5